MPLLLVFLGLGTVALLVSKHAAASAAASNPAPYSGPSGLSIPTDAFQKGHLYAFTFVASKSSIQSLSMGDPDVAGMQAIFDAIYGVGSFLVESAIALDSAHAQVKAQALVTLTSVSSYAGPTVQAATLWLMRILSATTMVVSDTGVVEGAATGLLLPTQQVMLGRCPNGYSWVPAISAPPNVLSAAQAFATNGPVSPDSLFGCVAGSDGHVYQLTYVVATRSVLVTVGVPLPVNGGLPVPPRTVLAPNGTSSPTGPTQGGPINYNPRRVSLD